MKNEYLPWNKTIVAIEYVEKQSEEEQAILRDPAETLRIAHFQTLSDKKRLKEENRSTMLVEAVSTSWGGNIGSIYLVLRNMVERHEVFGENILTIPESAVICEVKRKE